MRSDEQPIRLTLIAPNGRMGQAIARAAEDDGGFVIDADHGDVLVDFSAPAALQASLDRAVSAGVPILIGTTGLDDLAANRIEIASREVAVLRAPNTSLGIAVLSDLVERAAGMLGTDWDIEIVEMHHRMKADAPSGTALLFGDHPHQHVRIGRALIRLQGRFGFLLGRDQFADPQVLLGHGHVVDRRHASVFVGVIANRVIRRDLLVVVPLEPRLDEAQPRAAAGDERNRDEDRHRERVRPPHPVLPAHRASCGNRPGAGCGP
jgi:4-hydroxy-tetrahydrodipicolinate reductase